MSIILGIDPGSRKTGFGIVEYNNKKLKFLDCGVIDTGNGELAVRLEKIFSALSEVITLYKPDEAAIEQVFLYKNAKSALVLGHARGAAMVATTHQGLPLAEYSPREIKLAVVGYGGAKNTAFGLIFSLAFIQPRQASENLHGACFP